MKTAEEKKTMLMLAAIIETVAEAGTAIAGHMYAAFMSYGVSLEQFNALMAAACRTGCIKSAGAHQYVITEKGKELVKQIAAAKAKA